jgi:iron complex outermembrane receptor protein
MNRFRTRLLASTVIAGVTLMLPALASAQSTGGGQPPQCSAQDQQAGKCQQSNEVSEVVVTGSRIHRNEYNSAAPIQVLSGDTATLEGLANTAEILSTSSLVAGSFQVNNQLTGFVVTGGPGSSTIQLRGLGANRTLVLVDGHRMGPAGVGGTVGPFDLNVIPASIIDRIEILKDGASSIYGSDAVAGVINVITKKNLDGGIINAYADATQYGGGNQYDVNAAWGKVFDKGYWNLAFDYYDQEPLRASQRPDTACAADYEFDANGKQVDRPSNFNKKQCFNLFANAFETPLNIAGFSTTAPHGGGGTLILIYPNGATNIPDAQHGNSDGLGQPIVGGFVREDRAGFPQTYPYDNFSSPLYDRQTVVSPSKLYTLTGKAGYDLNADTEVYAGFLFNRRESEQDGARQFFPDVFAGLSNVPAGIRANPFTFKGPYGPILLPIAPLKFDFAQRVDYWNVDGGIRGKFGNAPIFGGWDWDIHARASRSDGKYSYDFIYNDRVNAITGLGANSSFITTSLCNQNQITISGHQKGGQCSTLGGNGVPLLAPNELAGKFTAAESAFLFGNETGRTTYDEQEIEASMTGDLFTLPAGKLSAAIGADYRHNTIDDVPGFNDRSGNLWGQTSSGITKGSDNVKEVFGEIDAPLVKGFPVIKSLDLQASARYTNYDIGGANSTYKVGLNWQVTDWLRLRGTKGTSFRAPALYELFLANQTGFLGQGSVDPCVRYEDSGNANLIKNCASVGVPVGYAGNGSSALVTTGGGAGHLKSETSDATTFGFIFTPTFMDFSIAVDYTDITVKNEVTTFGAFNIENSCYGSADFPNNPFCSLFTPGNGLGPGGREIDPNSTRFNQIINVNNSYVNVATQTERAIDVTARYRHDFDLGRLEVDTQLTWDLENTTQLFQGVPQPSYSGTTFAFKGPAFAGLTAVRFDHGPWTALWTIQMIGHGSDTDLIGSSAPSTRYSTTCRNNTTHVVGDCSTVLGNPFGSTITVLPVTVQQKHQTEFTSYHTISLRRSFDTWVIQGGVQNVFNERPPAVSSGEFRFGTAALNGYDMFGRRFFLNVKKSF